MEADFGVVQFPGDGIDGAVGNDLVFLGDQQRVIAVGHRLHQIVLYHRALQGGNLLAQFGDLATLIVLTAAKQRDGADHFRTEIGGSARIVDVQKILLRETALGDDHTECPGRIVAVFIGQSCLQLRIEGRQAFPICASALAMRSLAMCMSGLRSRARSRA